MPHDAVGREIVLGDRVLWGKQPCTVEALDSTVCAATIKNRGSYYLVPCSKLQSLEPQEQIAVA